MVFGHSEQSCGKLFCTGGWEFPVTSKKSFYKVGNGDMCNEATMNPEDNYPADLAMVPTGTKCGNNRVRKLKFPLTAWTKTQTSHPQTVLMCLSGMLRTTVSRHQKHKSVWHKWMFCKVQQPRGKKSVNSTLELCWSLTVWLIMSVVSGRFVTMSVSVIVTRAGPPLSAMCSSQSCLKVLFTLSLWIPTFTFSASPLSYSWPFNNHTAHNQHTCDVLCKAPLLLFAKDLSLGMDFSWILEQLCSVLMNIYVN